MSRKTEPEYLAELPDVELERRTSAAVERVENRAARARVEARDFTPRESDLSEQDRDELAALNGAIEARSRNNEQRETRNQWVQDAVDGHVETRSAQWPLLVSREHLEQHAAALREGRTFAAAEVETRSRVTAASDMGARGDWVDAAPHSPRHLIAFSGMPVSLLTGRRAELPSYTGPTGAAGSDENTAHGEYFAVDPVSLTAARYGRWTNVSSLVNVVDDLVGINQMHAWGIARDFDLLAVTAVQTAAGAPATLVSLESQVREAILAVAAATYSDETQLVIFGTPADLAPLTATTPTNAGDVGSLALRFGAARIYPSTAAASGQVTVFAPGSFRTFQSKLQSALILDPTDGSSKFGQWTHATPVAEQIIGSAAAVATA